MNSVSQRIKNIRVTRNETLEEFARKIRNETDGKIKTTKSNVSKWEKGLNIPNDITLKAIANLGDVSVKYILTGEDVITISTSEYERLKKIENKFNELSKSK